MTDPYENPMRAQGPSMEPGGNDDLYDPRSVEDSNRGPLVLALATGVLLVFGAVVFNAYRQGVRENGDPPRIEADNRPWKSAPGEPQTQTDPKTQLHAFDKLDGSKREDAISPANVREEMVALPEEVVETPADANAMGGPPMDLRPSTPGGTPPPDRALADLERVPPAPAVEEPSLFDEPLFDFDPNGNFLVQIMAVRSEDEAALAWAQLEEAKREMLVGSIPNIQRADLGARGVFYRLRVDGFAERAEASRFCDALKARQQDCIVVTR